MPLTTVLLDLDGVVRHFDPAYVEAVEQRHGLNKGILHATAFQPDLLQQVITGQIRRVDWVEAVGESVGNRTAATECFAVHGTPDQAMLEEVRALRRAGVVVAILTNGTDTIAEEMKALGLDSQFDAIFSSAEIGVAKPDRRVFETVCRRLGVEPAEVFFTDDSESKLKGAVEIGMTARLFEGIDLFRRHLADANLNI